MQRTEPSLALSSNCHPVGTLRRYDSLMNNVVSFLRDTKSIGELSELIVAAELGRAGYHVSLPLGESKRYDLIVDDGESLFRVQVKTGRLRNGAILFGSLRWSEPRNRQYSKIRWAKDYLVSKVPLPKLILVGSGDVDVVTETDPAAPS